MGLKPALDLDYLSPAELAERPAEWWQGVLGLVAFDTQMPVTPVGALPMALVQTPVLGGNPHRYEVWHGGERARSGSHGRIKYRHTASLVFGCVTIDESELQHEADSVSALQRATELAYREVFGALESLGMPHLVRVWNYLPDINAVSHGTERYWQFNSARQDAFIATGRTLTGAVPAACGVGSRLGTPLVIYFLASSSAPCAIENPRQVSAYHYPPEYSPRSPTFSRACTVELPGVRALFISGTASILGHATVHIGDAGAQTRETLRNIETLLEAANRPAAQLPPFAIDRLLYKAYVRHASDIAAIDTELRAALGVGAQVLYLHADLCREDLLVEIEATGCSSPSAKS